MKKILKVLGWTLLVLVGAFVILRLLPDEKLKPEVQAWMETRPSPYPEEDNVFYTVWGFLSEGDSHAVGRTRVSLIEKNIDRLEKFFDEPEWQESYRAAAGTPITDEDRNTLCRPDEANCVEALRTNRVQFEQLLAKYRLVSELYAAMQKVPHYHSTLTPDVRIPLPGFPHVMAAHLLKLAEITLTAGDGNVVAAIDALDADLAQLRTWLADSNDPIAKMVFSRMALRDLHLYAQLTDLSGPASEVYARVERIPPFAGQELSLAEPLRNEFRAVVRALVHDTTADLSVMFIAELENRLVLYKPNATINRLYAPYRAAADRAALPAGAFVSSSHAEDGNNHPSWWQYVYNPRGVVLAGIAAPDFDIFTYRIQGLEVMTRLVKLKARLRAGNVTEANLEEFLKSQAAELGNAYTGKPMAWDAERKVLHGHPPDAAEPMQSDRLTTYHELPLRFAD